MITENIAKEAALLLSEQLLHILQDSTNLIKNKHLEQFKRASNLWLHVKKEFQATEVARNIVLDMEATPDNEIVLAIFRHQLSKHLKEDDDFAWNIEHILFVQDFRTPIRKTVSRVKQRSDQGSILITNQPDSSQSFPQTLVDINTLITGERTQDTQHSGD